MPFPAASRRAPPNVRFDLWTGPLGVPPGVLLAANVPGRLVQSSDFTPGFPGSPNPIGYLTFTAPAPHYAVAARAGPSVIGYNLNSADQIAITTGGPKTHGVVMVDVVFPLSGIQYYRAWLCVLPY